MIVEATARALREGFDGVLHFAALSLVRSVRDPGLYYRTNVEGTLNLLEAIVAAAWAGSLFLDGGRLRQPERIPIPQDALAPTNPTAPRSWPSTE